MLAKQEVEVLRALAGRYMEFAAQNTQRERRGLWGALNERRMQRPMVMLDQIPWHEMDVDGSLQCVVQDAYWRALEAELRQTIYRCEHMPGDLVLPECICLITPTTGTDWGIARQTYGDLQTDAASDIHSRAYACQFKTMEDVEKLQMPTIRRDRAREALLRQEAHFAFDGVAPFCFSGSTGPMSHNMTLWDWICEWMGVTEIYYAIYDDPDLLHAIMRRMTEGMLGLIRQMNAEGLFDITRQSCHCTMTFTDSLPGAAADPEHATSRDAWTFGQAQLFSSCAPEVTAEFEIPYMQQLYSQFGAGYYGCCERLDDRMDLVAQIPNVRKVSCSAWSDCERFAEQASGRFVMSCKPNPAIFAGESFDLDYARADLRRLLDAARRHGADVEIIMKDVSTAHYDPRRLWAWAEMAQQLVTEDKYRA